MDRRKFLLAGVSVVAGAATGLDGQTPWLELHGRSVIVGVLPDLRLRVYRCVSGVRGAGLRTQSVCSLSR